MVESGGTAARLLEFRVSVRAASRTVLFATSVWFRGRRSPRLLIISFAELFRPLFGSLGQVVADRPGSVKSAPR